MSTNTRKSLVKDIRRVLPDLSEEELFRIAKSVGPVPDRDKSMLTLDDDEYCLEYINAYMMSESLLKSEDAGLTELLMLKDMIDESIKSTTTPELPVVDTSANTHTPHSSHQHTQSSTINVAPNTLDADYQQMLSTYEELGRKLLLHRDQQTSHTSSPDQTHRGAHTDIPRSQSGLRERASEKAVPLRDLSYLNRREFKIQGGQIGDNTSDISYTNVRRQIDEGVREGFSETEVTRGLLRIIKPGSFKDMLMNKEDMTVAELKGFLRSHLEEKNSTEIFQELMSAKQSENETPQQFLYRVIGLKNKLLFTATQAEADFKYSPETVQGMFLHTVHQGLGLKHNDLRRELRPLLSDSTVTDDMILTKLTKITSEENERQRRLGPTPRPKPTHAHSVQLEEENNPGTKPKKESAEQKPKSKSVEQLSEQVEALTNLVASLANQFSAVNQPYAPRRDRPYGCRQCVDQSLPNCPHCFFCCEEGHRLNSCPKKQNHPGNGVRSLARGNQ